MRKFLLAFILVALAFLPSVSFAQATYLTQANLATDADFVKRVKVGIIQVAVDITNENTATVNHVRRADLAQRVAASPDAWASVMAWGVVADTSITAASTDAQLKTRLSAIWNTYAGLE